MGFKKNVVVLTRPVGYRKEKEKMIKLVQARYGKYPEMVKALRFRDRIYNETMDHIDEGVENGTIFRIAPVKDLGIGRLEKNKNKLKLAYEEGYFVAEAMAEKLKEFLDK